MKKTFFSLLVFAGLALSMQSVKAQTIMTNPNGLALDTVTNSTAEGPVLQVKGFQSTVSMVLLVTKISGTIAGYVYWQGSNDGVNYATIGSDTLTDATNRYQYDEAPKRYLYYKALISPSGTSSLSYKAHLYATKQ